MANKPDLDGKFKRLGDLMGDGGSVSGDVVKEAIAEIHKESADDKKAKFKELYKKAMALKTQRDKVVADLAKQEKKWDKELGGVIGRMEAWVHNKPEPKEEEEKEGATTED